jgi:hypothetical protein
MPFAKVSGFGLGWKPQENGWPSHVPRTTGTVPLGIALLRQADPPSTSLRPPCRQGARTRWGKCPCRPASPPCASRRTHRAGFRIARSPAPAHLLRVQPVERRWLGTQCRDLTRHAMHAFHKPGTRSMAGNLQDTASAWPRASPFGQLGCSLCARALTGGPGDARGANLGPATRLLGLSCVGSRDTCRLRRLGAWDCAVSRQPLHVELRQVRPARLAVVEEHLVLAIVRPKARHDSRPVTRVVARPDAQLAAYGILPASAHFQPWPCTSERRA